MPLSPGPPAGIPGALPHSSWQLILTAVWTPGSLKPRKTCPICKQPVHQVLGMMSRRRNPGTRVMREGSQGTSLPPNRTPLLGSSPTPPSSFLAPLAPAPLVFPGSSTDPSPSTSSAAILVLILPSAPPPDDLCLQPLLLSQSLVLRVGNTSTQISPLTDSVLLKGLSTKGQGLHLLG